jgi:microcompartment protein CcmL/EutN
MGMVAVKIQGQVSAVQSAVAAARAAASRISKVFATSVIPRPSDQLDPVVLTDVTVGLAPKPEPEPEPEPERASPVPATPLAELSESQPAAAGTDSDKSEGEGGVAAAVPAPVERTPAARTRKPSTTRTKK